MNPVSRTALSGWAAVMLFAAGAASPYLFRSVRVSGSPYLRRLWPHYWIGYLLTVLSILHAWLSMSQGNMRGVNMTGLWLATVALLSTIWQIALGLMLRSAAPSGCRALCRTHFWTMAVMAWLIVIHIALNRP